MNKEIIGVIGAGTMGGGIAQMFAENGFQVLLWDASPEFLDKGLENIRKRLNKSVEKGKQTAAEADAVFGRLGKAAGLESFAPADLIIEAVTENSAVKAELYRKLEKIVHRKTIIGSNTSSLSISGLAGSLASPERFLGMHFFNPPTKLELVEVVATPVLAPEVRQKVNALLARCGKKAVNVGDSPGFIVNRLLLPFINEAAKLLDAGTAGAEDIDAAMCLGALHPAGPLQVADLIGLDICEDILEKLAETLKRPDFKPAAAISSRVRAGKLGRKTGEGFYAY